MSMDVISENIASRMDAVQSIDHNVQNLNENQEDDQQSVVNPVKINSTTNGSAHTNMYSLELSLVLFGFSISLSGPAFQTEIIYQGCMLKSNESICRLLASKEIPEELKELETEVEIYVSYILMVWNVLGNIVPIFISFFIAQWSNRFGRRPLLLSSFFGYFVSFALLCVISIAANCSRINPWLYLLPYILPSLLGSMCTLITGIYSYTSDISLPEDRGYRLARVGAASSIGNIIGVLSFAPMYNQTSAAFTFGCSTCCSFIALTCIYFFLTESIEVETEQISFVDKYRALFDWKHVVDLFRTCLKRREHSNHILVWLLIATLVLGVVSFEGASSIFFLFMRRQFQWTPTDFTHYVAFSLTFQVFGNLFGTYVINKTFGMPDILVILISLFSGMSEYVFISLADHSSQFYMATVLTILRSLYFPMCRGYLASLVHSSELGNVFSVATSMETLAQVVAVPIYTFIYDNTIDTYAGAYNILSAFIMLVCILVMTIVFFMRSQRQETFNYQRTMS